MIKLWNQTMPHRCVEDAFEPYLTPYDCDAAKTAIVVCPGGAYCGRADYEGNDVGAWLNPINLPDSCYFKNRCARRCGQCDGGYPEEIKVSDTHYVSCYLYDKKQ